MRYLFSAKRITPLAASVLTLIVAACGEVQGGETGASVRDSAGIRVVESTAPAWAEGEDWRVGTEPVVEIGMVEGPPAYLLDRVAGALRLRDGRIVVANGGSGELRFFAADGSHLSSVGGEGKGPGEYSGISWIEPFRGDSILVYDFVARRLSVLSHQGEYARSLGFPIAPEGGFPVPTGAFVDGSLAGRVTAVFTAGEMTTGMHDSQATYVRLSGETGALLDSITTLPDESRYILAEPTSMSVTTPLLGPQTYRAVAGDSLFLGYSGSFQINAYGSDGVLRSIIRRVAEPVPVTADELTRLREERLSVSDDPTFRERLGRIYDAMPAPQVRPAFSSLQVDEAGNLWVRSTVLPDEPELWTVFDDAGRMLGTLQLPDGFRPLHIGEDFLLGLVDDELGVQRVRLYDLQKP